MDIYQATVSYISQLPVIQQWPEVQAIMTHAAKTKPKYWELPLRICLALGETEQSALPAVSAIACAQTSILLIDDMLDDDPRGEYHQQGFAKVSNYAAALQATALEAFSTARLPQQVQHIGLYAINHMMATTAFGQHLDTQTVTDEDVYWKITTHKSAPFFGAALYLGALTGHATLEVARQIEMFGKVYGEMVQIHDDLNDTMATPANPDWLQKRSPLPILFGQLVNYPERQAFLSLRDDILAPNALTQAQEILIHCGAVSYCIHQLLCRQQTALQLLKNIELANKEAFYMLLQEIMAPVEQLLQTIENS